MISRIAWAVLVVGLGSFHLSQAWAGWQAALVIILAAVVPIGLVALGERLKVKPGAVVAVLAAAVTLGTYLLTTAADTGFVTTLRDAVPRLLTAPRPAPPILEMVLPGALLAAVLGLVVAARIVREGRSLVAPPAAAAVMYVAAALLTDGSSDRYGLLAVGLLVLTVAGWLLLDRPAGRRQVALGSAVTALAVCGCVALVAAVVPLAGAFEPRRLVNPPSQRLSEPSPLPRLAAWALQGDVELMRVQGEPRPMRLVALSDFTGAYWRTTAVYRPLGANEQAALPPGDRRVSSTLNVLVSGLDGPWLPTAGEPTSVSLADIAVDPNSGSTVVTGGLRAGMRYQITCDGDDTASDDIATATTADGPAAEPYLSTPSLPWQLEEYARQATHTASTAYEQAVALEHAVRSGRKLDPSAPTGSSYARLTTFLLGGPNELGAQAGTAEQFAAAFAVLARAVRLPTRVVVGFHPGDRAADGTFTVRGRHATAWPEIYFDGWGWQRFQPAPVNDGTGSAVDPIRQKVLTQLAERSTATITPVPAQSAPRPEPTAPAAPQAVPPGPQAPRDLGLVFALIVGIVALPLLAVAGARTVRRAGHRRAGPFGAWAEVLDLLILLRRPTQRWQAAPDIAAALAALLPPGEARDGVIRLAAAADRAAFSPAPPRQDSQCWQDVRMTRRAIRNIVPWHRRLLWLVDPRPLRRR
ncbi:transglutaminase domain-containing protein [Kibdelosporangium aridum]|uniref:Transglutaminase domain-containing protein n=1 Tax=Kibdelosporangium aridum TaxID=2030 RepID=A0A428Z5B7_KIBAR|nr:transglutaminase domain-containing protein [Kibdelosporangium aridum]RSM81983.1 transglutaminase domain-containing protein [Kibdelosporangium aridum]